MARVLYINQDPATQTRATTLGCGWMPQVPPEFANIATAPCVIISGDGRQVVLPEPTTPQAVDAALQPFLAAEAAAGAAQLALNTNGDTLRARAQAALTANATFLALATPSNAQTLAQVQTLTKECTALIRLLLGQLDSTAGT